MSGDRDLSLIRKAIFGGHIESTEVKLLDRKWWRWLGRLLSHLESESLVRLFEMKHSLQCGVLSYQNKQEVFDLHWDEAVTLQGLVRKELLPWLPDEGADRRSSAKRLIDTWTQTFGDPEDEATKSKITATIKHLEEQARAGRQKFGGGPR